MATNFVDITAAIKAKAEELTTIQVVYDYERSTFDGGQPALVIAPTSNESRYGSTQNDRMVFVFDLRVYYQVPEEGEHDVIEGYLRKAIDEILTMFKERNVLGTACDWVEPTPSAWFYEARDAGVYRVATVVLRCVKYVG